MAMSEIAWARLHSPLTERAIRQLPRLDGARIAFSIHLDIKMATALIGFLEKGAKVFLTTCNPATVNGAVVQMVYKAGGEGWVWEGMTDANVEESVRRAIAWGPTHTCEMGANITVALHSGEWEGVRRSVRAGMEATGSGVTRLLTTKPSYPVFNWDDIPVKEGVHNRHMVGLTAWHTFTHTTRLSLHGKRVLVIGYGLVGKGVATAARAIGGVVTVHDIDPARRIIAVFDGMAVCESLLDALPHADVVVTATGARNVLKKNTFPLLRHHAFLMNVGHASDEIDTTSLLSFPHTTLLPNVEAVDISADKRVFLLAKGAMFNLSAGTGDTINAFDVTLAVMVTGVGSITTTAAEQMPPGVHILPRSVWIPAVNTANL